MKLQKNIIHERLHFLLLACIVFTLPFSIKLNSIFIILCGINWLIEGDLLNKLKTTFSDKTYVCWILLFMLHIISVALSDNHHEAIAIIERRLSFFVFPLLLSRPTAVLQLKSVLNVFLASVAIASAICIVYAFKQFGGSKNEAVFYYHQLSSAINMNAVYLSAYVLFAINILLQKYFTDKLISKSRIILFILFLNMLLLLSSKMMLFILFVNLTVWMFYLVSEKKYFAFIFIAILIVMSTSIYFSPFSRARFITEFQADSTPIYQDKFSSNTSFSGTSLRIVIWKLCLNILNEKNAWLTGVGTGDLQDLLNEKYRASGMYTGNKALNDTGYIGYGPHSEYIEILLALGVTGLLVFLTALALQLKQALYTHNVLLLQLSIMAGLFFITESALGISKGIVFFMVFFTTLKQTEKN